MSNLQNISYARHTTKVGQKTYDIVIKRVVVRKEGNLQLYGMEKNGKEEILYIDIRNIFPGQLEYVTGNIC